MLAEIGFGLSAIGYCMLLLLLFTVRKAGLAKYLLIIATAVTAVWSLSHITTLFGPMSLHRLLLMDNIKQTIWLVFLLSCMKDDSVSLRQVLTRPVSMMILVVPLANILVPLLYSVPVTWRLLTQTIVALQVLLLLELIYRQAADDRWAFKPLILFLGATNLYEFVTFANATMVEALEPAYIAARGFIYVALIPFLVLAIRRIRTWGVDIFISRDVVLHSSLLMVAGGYLMVMALAGYAVRYVGGEWGSTIQIVLIVLSLAVLATVFLSNSFRVRIKVFITKHFFANQFDYRIEWVKLTEALSGADGGLNSVYHNALNGFLQAIDYRSGSLLKRVGGQNAVVASINQDALSDSEQEVLAAISQFAQGKNWIVDLEELRYKPFVYEGLKVNHALLNDCSFQLVLPIYRDTELWGMALLSDGDATRKLNWELRDYLSAVTAQVSSYVFHNEASQEVAENAQFAAFNRMSAFVLHDLKNVLAQIDLILCNAEQHKSNPEFIDDTFETLKYTKARMEKMLRQLTDKNEAERSRSSAFLASDVIQRVIDKKCASYLPKPSLQIINERQVVLDEEKFSNVIYHLVSNAQQATDDTGSVELFIDTDVSRNQLQIRITDTGCGMSADFIASRLFKPFDTTKGNAGMGIGAYDAKNFLEKVGGHLAVDSKEGEGTTFTITLPLE